MWTTGVLLVLTHCHMFLHTLFPHLKFGQDCTCLNQPKPSKWGTAFTTMPCAIKRSSARDGKNLLKISLMTVGFRVDWALRCAASLRALGLTGASMRSTPTSAVARGSKHLLHGFHRRLRFQKCETSPTLWNQMGRSVQDHSWRWTCLIRSRFAVDAGFVATQATHNFFYCSGHFSSTSWLFSAMSIRFIFV